MIRIKVLEKMLYICCLIILSGCSQTFHKTLMNSDTQRYLLVWGNDFAHMNEVELEFKKQAFYYCPEGYEITAYNKAVGGMDLNFLFGQPYFSTSEGLEGKHRIEGTIKCF